MKRIRYAIVAVLAVWMMFSGCGTVDSEDELVYVSKNGQIKTVDVEEFDKAYYSEEAFTAFAKEAVDAYNELQEADAVELEEITVEEGTAKLKMLYQSAADYSNFNEVTLYQGSVAAAISDGYLFDADFSRVEKGEITGKASRTDILAEEGLSVVIIKANTNVKIDGTICYVSAKNVTVTAKDMVTISDEENTSLMTDVCTYIIYK